MNLEFVVSVREVSYKVAVHYRLIGEKQPLCSQYQSEWHTITFKERAVKFVKNPICMKCVQGKRRLERLRE